MRVHFGRVTLSRYNCNECIKLEFSNKLLKTKNDSKLRSSVSPNIIKVNIILSYNIGTAIDYYSYLSVIRYKL